MGRDPYAVDAGHLQYIQPLLYVRARREYVDLQAPRKPPMPADVRQRMDEARNRVARRLDFEEE